MIKLAMGEYQVWKDPCMFSGRFWCILFPVYNQSDFLLDRTLQLANFRFELASSICANEPIALPLIHWNDNNSRQENNKTDGFKINDSARSSSKAEFSLLHFTLYAVIANCY